MINYFRYRRLYLNKFKASLLLIFKKRYFNFFEPYSSGFQSKVGLEIGGPSNIFKSALMPIYKIADKIDGCNFSNNTIWEGNIDTHIYKYDGIKTGTQFICEGSDLSHIADKSYDFLLSCHNLEHISNPLKAVKEWHRVIKKDGMMLLILPDKRYTFDRKRPDTTFSHIKMDFQNNIDETDLTHLDEIISLHDLGMHGGGVDVENLKKWGKENFINRGLHHHVFSDALLKEMFAYFNIETLSQYFIPPNNKVIIGRKKST